MTSRKLWLIRSPTAALILSAYAHTSRAAENPVIITWHTNTYAPEEYRGKALPVTGSLIQISALILNNNKPVDPKEMIFEWYLDNERIDRGVGLNKTTIKASKRNKEKHIVSVKTVNLSTEEVLYGNRDITIISPKVSIKTNTPNLSIKRGEVITFQALPAFFSIKRFSDFKIEWDIDGVKYAVGADNLLTLDTANLNMAASKKRIAVGVTVRNSQELLEQAKNKIWIDIIQ